MNTNDTFGHIDLSYMDLMADGDTDMKQTMLDMLVDELPAEIQKIQRLSQEKNFQDLKSVAHKLKSTLAFVGNTDLDEANKEVEKIAKGEMVDEKLPQLTSFMMDECQLVLGELKEVITKLK